MNKIFSFSQTGTLSRQLSQRILSLSIIALLGLLALVGVGLQSSFQSTQTELILARNAAANSLTKFLGGLNDDLRATSDALTTTTSADDIFRRALERQPAIFELDYINTSGTVLNQRRRVGQAELAFTEQPWLETVKAGETYIGAVDYSEFGVPFVTVAVPVIDRDGNFKGTLVSITDLTALWRPVTNLKVGETGYIYIADETGKLLAFRNLTLVQNNTNIQTITGRTPQTIAQSDINVHSGVNGSLAIASGQSLDLVPWFVIVEQPVSEALRTFAWLSGILLFLLVFVVIQANSVFRFTQRRIVEPLGLLQQGVKELQSGRLEHPITVKTRDELGDLASTFNSMATQLSDLIGSLENRVVERTQALAISGEISRRLSTISEQDKLFSEVVEQLKSGFNYYHAHIYLLAENGETLLMAGGTGQAGQILLDRGHSIPVGRGLVGRAAETKNVVLVPNTRKEAEWLPNPLLPDTQSEIAIPIMLGEHVLGVLDVQNDVADSLGEQDASLIRTIADQVAIALQNIRSSESVAKRAAELQTVAAISTSISTIQDVQQMLETVVHLTQRRFGLYHAHVFLYDQAADELAIAACGYKEGDEHEGTHGTTTIPVSREQSLVARAARTRQPVIVNDVRSDPGWLPNPLLPDTLAELAVPMIVGDQLLGVLDVQSENIDAFTQEDASIQTTLASQVAVALQNARSFAQTRQQAERETALNMLTQRIQGTTSMEDALKIAARELGHLLHAKTVVNLESAGLKTDDKNVVGTVENPS